MTLYYADDHRVWDLGRDYLDERGVTWHWDGRPFGGEGPDMEAAGLPLAHEPLLGLANCAGLHGDTAPATQLGHMVLQIHDEIEAGRPHPEVRHGAR